MAPTIRVDDEVFEALKALAEPLVDTPNSVLHRVLGIGASGGASRPGTGEARGRGSGRRARRGSTLPDREYELPLLEVLEAKGGRAPTAEVLDALGVRLGKRLKSTDRGRLSSGEIRWRNRAQFVRLRLVEQGDMKASSPRGVWEISTQGRRRIDGDRR